MGNFEIHDTDIEQYLWEAGSTIGENLPNGWGFTLFLFKFGEGGATFYVSNARREDMLKALVEFIMRQHAEGEER